MRIGLFVPCYIDQFYPDVAVSTLELLEAAGAEVDFPAAQTCCGQPMANTGCSPQAAPMAERFVEIFSDPSYDYIVCPSGSCTAMVVHHYDEYFPAQQSDQRARRERFENVRDKTLELSQFLYRVAKPESFPHAFPHRVGLHNSCHGLRELRLGSCSERMTRWDDSVCELLSRVPELQWAELQRSDECCGFGGTFAVAEADVSAAMGRSRIADHADAGAEVMVAGDMSCLMHLQGLIQRDQRPLHTMHFAQVLAGRPIDINTSSSTTPTQTTR
ncbi:(Fe-S)-binding protein [Roseimaritima ulvae]|uniref:Lactate utilization protein A n=1 Tax=Roseimaritima ulvae TaxID=980254 RepID=A0A5B9QWH5_9BACT|nr:(Fe-S)-binding protein [Roseimaritima ulvae]QEG41456.1 Lactate utilization protein A [Roseimaritima ulvae]